MRGPFGCLVTGAGGLVWGGGGVGFGCGVSSCAATGAAEGAIAEMPAASNSRNRCARVVAAGEDAVATGADDDVGTGVSAGRGSNVACGSVEPDVFLTVTADGDGPAASVAVFTVYDRTRTINAVANATVNSVRKTERNEIWTCRRTR